MFELQYGPSYSALSKHIKTENYNVASMIHSSTYPNNFPSPPHCVNTRTRSLFFSSN